MLEICANGILLISRGDSAEIPLFINQGNKLYPIRYKLRKDQPAYITFAIMTALLDIDNALLKKYYNVNSPHTEFGDPIIVLEPTDTLRFLPGKYFYSARLTHIKHGHACNKTIIPKRMFIIKE